MTEATPSYSVNYAPVACLVAVSDWEQRLLALARQLRSSNKSDMLIVEFQGGAVKMYTTVRAGKVE